MLLVADQRRDGIRREHGTGGQWATTASSLRMTTSGIAPDARARPRSLRRPAGQSD